MLILQQSFSLMMRRFRWFVDGWTRRPIAPLLLLLVAFNILLLLASFKKARRHIRAGVSNLNQKEKCNRKRSQK